MSLFAFGGDSMSTIPQESIISDGYLNSSSSSTGNTKHKYLSEEQVFTIKDMMNSLGMTSTKNTNQDTGLEYLFEEDGSKSTHRQSFGSRLAYGTGSTYLSGI